MSISTPPPTASAEPTTSVLSETDAEVLARNAKFHYRKTFQAKLSLIEHASGDVGRWAGCGHHVPDGIGDAISDICEAWILENADVRLKVIQSWNAPRYGFMEPANPRDFDGERLLQLVGTHFTGQYREDAVNLLEKALMIRAKKIKELYDECSHRAEKFRTVATVANS